MGHEMHIDIDKAHPQRRTESIDGHRMEFRPYIGVDGEEYLIWRIDRAQGDTAILDSSGPDIVLPQGRQIEFNGQTRRIIPIPQYLSGGLVSDFKDLRSGGVKPLDGVEAHQL